MVIFGLSFPIIYQVINDTGPVRLGIFMSVFAPLFVKIIVHIRQNYIKILFNIILGFMLFLAVEDKPFFLYFIPSIGLLVIAYNHEEKQEQRIIDSTKFLLKKTWISLVIFASFTLLYLLVAKTSSGQIYILELMKAVKPRKFTETLNNLLSFMANFQKFSSMVYDHRRFRFLNISFSLLIWYYGFLFIAKTCKNDGIQLLPIKILLTSLALVSSMIVLLFTRNAWTGHHFIYPYTFALLIICQSTLYAPERKKRFFISYSFLSIFLAGQLLLFVPKPHSSWERYKIFEYLKQEAVAKNYIITHLSLGTYYISSLYGHKDQLSLQIEKLDGRTAMQVINLSDMTQRKILCICHGPDCNSEKLSDSFLRKIEFEEVNLSNNDWKIHAEKNRF
jgi:hypothetical protein